MQFVYTHLQGMYDGSIIVQIDTPEDELLRMSTLEIKSLAHMLEPNLTPVPRVSDNNIIEIDYIPHDGQGKITVTTTYSHDTWLRLSESERTDALDDLIPDLQCVREK